MGLKITDVKNITRQNCSNVEMLFCSWWIAPACYSIETIDTEMCGFEQKKKKKNHDGNVQMGRRGGMGLYECVSVGGGALPRGTDSDRLAWENCDADPLIKIDVLPFCFKCN